MMLSTSVPKAKTSSLVIQIRQAKRRLALREYQQEMRASFYAAVDRGRRRLLGVLPTGSGKTVVFAHLALDVVDRGGRVLILAHRDELISQPVASIRDVAGHDISIGIEKAELNQINAQIVVGSVQTLAQSHRLQRLAADFDLIVIDEAHHAAAESYQRIIRHLGVYRDDGPTLLGVTATPDRGDGLGLDGVFEEIFFERSILDLMQLGYLVDIKAHQVAVQADFNSLHTRGGDIVASEAGQILMAANAPQAIAGAMQTFAADRKSLVFAPLVDTAYAIADACKAVGIRAAGLDGETPAIERRQILNDLRSGKLQAIVNVGVLTEGYDDPSIDCIVLARPTKSRGLFSQMIGRGLRPYPGKTDCLLLDLVGDTMRNDLVSPASLFGLDPSDLKQKTVSEALAAKKQAEIAAGVAGDLVSAEIDLFRQRPAHWVPVNGGRFVLPTGHGTLVLRQTFGDRWDVLEVVRGQSPRLIVSGMTLGAAQGYAETAALATGAGALIDRGAPWRQGPPSEKQIKALRKLRVPVKGIATKGAASDALSAAIAALEVA